MSNSDAQLQQMFRDIRRASLPKQPTDTAVFVGATFGFGDGVTAGSATTGQGGYLHVPVPGRIIGLQVVSSTTITASFDLQLATYDDFPVFTPLWTTVPTITALQKVVIDVTAWSIRLLSPRDWLSYTLTLTSGSPTRIGVGLLMTRFASPYGSSTITDDDGNTITDSNGNVITVRL